MLYDKMKKGKNKQNKTKLWQPTGRCSFLVILPCVCTHQDLLPGCGVLCLEEGKEARGLRSQIYPVWLGFAALLQFIAYLGKSRNGSSYSMHRQHSYRQRCEILYHFMKSFFLLVPGFHKISSLCVFDLQVSYCRLILASRCMSLTFYQLPVFLDDFLWVNPMWLLLDATMLNFLNFSNGNNSPSLSVLLESKSACKVYH